jgi:hypothetical protein
LPYYVARYRQVQSGPRLSDEDDPRALSGVTIETPVFLPLEQRVTMHHVAIDATLDLLRREIARSERAVDGAV